MRAEEESCGTAGTGMFEEDDPVTWEALAFLGISGATENPVITTPTRRFVRRMHERPVPQLALRHEEEAPVPR
jgi:hypothetical protein